MKTEKAKSAALAQVIRSTQVEFAWQRVCATSAEDFAKYANKELLKNAFKNAPHTIVRHGSMRFVMAAVRERLDEVAKKLETAHRKAPATQKPEPRFFPKFEPGMSAAEYVAAYTAMNIHACLIDIEYTANSAPATLYENDAFDFDVIEEQEPEVVPIEAAEREVAPVQEQAPEALSEAPAATEKAAHPVPAEEQMPALAPRSIRSMFVDAVRGWETLGEDGSKEHPGFASEKSARIAISKNPEWKKRELVILPFDYNDGSVFSPYAATRTRFAIVARKKQSSPSVDAPATMPKVGSAVDQQAPTAAQEACAAPSTVPPEPVAHQAPPVAVSPEVQSPPVAVSREFVALMAQARQARSLAREAIARAQESSRAPTPPDDDPARAFPHLVPLTKAERHKGGTGAAPNIRRHLKKLFPGVKFGVTSDYSQVRVRWTDGPTAEDVDAALAGFDIGHSDCMTDYFYTEATRFSEVFGGVQYLFTNRAMSDAHIACVLLEVFGPHGPSVADYHAGKAWDQVPQGAYAGCTMPSREWLRMVEKRARES